MSTVKTSKNRDAATRALWRIAETDNTEDVESILADGADINASNAHGMTALMRAASRGQIQMVRVLLEHGANPNLSRNDKFTPLMLAAFFGHEEVVRVLVAHGADIGAATRSGASAQMWAAARTFEEVVHCLDNPDDSQGSCKAPADEHSRLQAQRERWTISIRNDDIEDLTTHAITIEQEGIEEEPPTLADAFTTFNETPEVYEALQGFAQRLAFISRLQPLNKGVVAFSLTALLVVAALIVGLTLQDKQRPNKVSPPNHSTVAVDGFGLTSGSANNSSGTKTISPFEAQVETLGWGNDLSTRYKKPENVAKEEDKSKQLLVTRSIVSTRDSRRGELSEERNRAANGNQPVPIPTDRPDDVRMRELPSSAASAKPQVAASRVTMTGNGPAPLPNDLISPSKSSPPKGRTIQWP